MARILVAEDEETLRSLVVRALGQVGHEVVEAADGAEALDLLARDHGRFDLLLTDIRMPLMDGIALALAAGRDYPDLVILLMTAYADQRERASGLDARIHDVITKPFTLAEIKVALNEALAAHSKSGHAFRESVGSGAGNVGRDEVVALEQERRTVRLGARVGQTVAEAQPRITRSLP